MKRKQNRLASETSPYLRQHAGNPVDWYPWGPEALDRARSEDKPVFLSVGYSSCHWCHVMEHESFENDGVAEILNRHFISIKVDREEHPDLDALYMTATQLVTQRGGWPNSVWLTPDGRPWYAGTYFPREDRHGRIGFTSLLVKLADIWKERRSDVEEQARVLTEAIAKQQEHARDTLQVAADAASFARLVQQHAINQFDARFGGFGDAPKFPPHSNLLLLLRSRRHAPDHQADIVVERTLDAMARGGIHDHIGGGFHRYSTDEHWLLPHFEKMLYDNALLLEAYARACAAFDRPPFRRIVRETAEWLAREMTHPDGGFYSALDADSEGEEGKCYTWSHQEVTDLLDAPARQDFIKHYRILPGGNFSDEATGRPTGLNIPHLDESTTEADIAALAGARMNLLRQRNRRTQPGLDNKIITGWNGLMIRALAVAARLLDMPDLLATALRARAWIENRMVQGDRVARSWCNGSVSTREGVLEDYAALALADIELFRATGDAAHLTRAQRGVNAITGRFLDADTDELFMTSRSDSLLIMRMKDIHDQGSPSGLGLAVQAIAQAGAMVDDMHLVALARRLTNRSWSVIQRMPYAVSTLAEAYLQAEDPGSCMAWDLASGPDGIRLVASLPPGWHLQDVSFRREEDLVSVDLPSAGTHQWHVPDEARANRGMTAVLVSFQPCSASECRTEQQARILLPPHS